MRWIKLHSGYMLLEQLFAVRYTVIWCVVTGTHCVFSAICKTILHLTTLYWGRSQPLELLNPHSMLKFIVTRAKAIPKSACYQYQNANIFCMQCWCSTFLSHSGGQLLNIASNQIVQIQPHMILQVFTDLWFMPLTNNQVIIAGVKVNEGSKMW